MGILEEVLSYERSLFFMLNGSNSNYLDGVMWLYSGKIVWIPVAFFILLVLFYKKDWKESLFILLAIVLVVTLCDQFASHLCKPLFTRFRPTHHPDFMNEVKTVFGYRGGRYGFMSSHAANALGFSTFMSLVLRYKPLTFTLLGWALLSSYSRIYLGVHFISDVVCGGLAGILFGLIVYRLYVYGRIKLLGVEKNFLKISIYSDARKRLIIYGVLATVLAILLFSNQIIEATK